MRYLLIVAMLMVAGAAWGLEDGYHVFNRVNDNTVNQQSLGSSYRDATDNTWHLWNGQRWLKCGGK